jgi:predicted Zn-dependent protease
VLLPGDASQGELVARVERGILVTQLHYVNLIDPRELLLTGMTRNGTFRIENGRVTHAIKNLRFTESLVRALSRVRGVGRDLAVSGALFEGEMIAPALAIDGFRFTSGTDF